MAFLEKDDIGDLYKESKQEARIWREDYPQFERLMENGLMDGLDPNLPEVNDGSLAAALFKLPKRIVNKKLAGTVKVLDKDTPWLAELANLQWQNEIIPNANSQAPFIRKWKDAVRKAAGYGSVPLITLFVETNGKRTTDFIVAQPQDVTLEPGKVSDYDSDVIFWDVYFTKLQLENMLEQAEEDAKPKAGKEPDEYNKWDIEALKAILARKDTEDRDGQDVPNQQSDKAVKKGGYKFCIAFQRGVKAPFYMYHNGTKTTVREWTNPDPTGDLPVHFLYCYQDFVNPYGTGIVKLAGGTQNVLDYMRQADILATQLGLRPPIVLRGNTESTDFDSIVYAQDAIWEAGQAELERQELANGVYQALPERMSMYKTSLNQLIPTGDTSIASGSGDPQYSKTPAGVKFQQAALSIDDEDFKDNLYITYEAVAKSMINTHFANKEGKDLMKLGDDEREILLKAGLPFPQTPDGEMSNEVEVIWDTVRAEFDFEVDPETDKAKDDADKLEGLTRVAELVAADPTAIQEMMAAGKKFNKGELYSEMIKLSSDNDKIITDLAPEEQQTGPDGAPMQPQMVDPNAPDPQAQQQSDEKHQMDMAAKQQDMDMKQEKHQMSMQPEGMEEITPEMQANIQAVMEEYGIDEQTALTALAAEKEGLPPEAIAKHLQEVAGAQR